MTSTDRNKKTIYIGGLSDSTNEETLLNAFSTFGQVVEVNIPRDLENQTRHRGFGFVVFSEPSEVDDAIDNMHLNVLDGRVINVNLARPLKTAQAGSNRPVWQDEEWLKQHATPLGGGGEDVGKDQVDGQSG
ncbi:RNA-binding domain-containing protein [Violaceomyces palustris]|uniref:RNA-binding domain-containing protein n=1 Tax=Violaceomyces palustris TaxID=1673888 RepID=A0ACD0NUH9_9BASI|nr:RNA-binding domain-containing protein [Violaceomyces palustris]